MTVARDDLTVQSRTSYTFGRRPDPAGGGIQ